jgi:hypothetical protein
MQESLSATERSLAHIYGVMQQEPWDGATERRHGTRRRGE